MDIKEDMLFNCEKTIIKIDKVKRMIHDELFENNVTQVKNVIKFEKTLDSIIEKGEKTMNKKTTITDKELSKWTKILGADKIIDLYIHNKIFLNSKQLDKTINIKNKKEEL